VEAERNKRGLEASPYADGNRVSSCPHAPAGIESLREGIWGRWLMGLSDLIPKQLPKSMTGAQSVSAASALTRCDTEGAD